MRIGRSLSAKQIAFADAYARGATKTAAAREAGYAPTASNDYTQVGTRCLRNPAIRALIREKREIYQRAALVTAADVVDRLWHEANRGSNQGFERIKALELLGRALGLFGLPGQGGQQAGAGLAGGVQIYLPDNGRPPVDLAALPEAEDAAG